MPDSLSQLRRYLSQKNGPSQYRNIYVLAGEIDWQNNFITQLVAGHEEKSLWLGEEAPNGITQIKMSHATSLLGQEKILVVFNANEGVNVDALAAISGVIVGGGLFFILLPARESWHDKCDSLFEQRFIHSIIENKYITVLSKEEYDTPEIKEASQQKNKVKIPKPYLTNDQLLASQLIEDEVHSKNNNVVVLVADRGRGKSATLGITAAKLIKSGIKNIIVTAPRLRATDMLFKHVVDVLPEAVFSRGKIIYKEQSIQFYPPDQLSNENISADLLLVDEAASIPVPILISFLARYPQCVFATTEHGYEGTGRGFTVKFNNVLKENHSGWRKYRLITPIRWPEEDPLEKWIFNLLCLNADIPEVKNEKDVDVNDVKYFSITRKELFNDNALLRDVFSLLVLAHYRTQPSDLQRLLDDDNISVYVAKYKEHIIAVTLISHEGSFTEEFSSDVYKGKRRAKGHLLAQALTYHCGIEHAAELSYARIMRIAVHPNLQNKNIGSQLIKYVIEIERSDGLSGIGTSYGMNKQLLNFWMKLGFNMARIGFKKEQTSGEHAAIMMLPLDEKGKKVNEYAQNRFNENKKYWFDDVLIDIPNDIKNIFPEHEEFRNELTQHDYTDLTSFISYSRNYELCIAAINKLVLLNNTLIESNSFPLQLKKVLDLKINLKRKWKEISIDMELNGQDEAKVLFKQGVSHLIKKNKTLCQKVNRSDW